MKITTEQQERLRLLFEEFKEKMARIRAKQHAIMARYDAHSSESGQKKILQHIIDSDV